MKTAASRYEKNVRLQPELIRRILDSPRPAWMAELHERRVVFVGIGSSFHAAQLAKRLWRLHVSPRSEAVHSFDFVRLPQPVVPGDVVAVFSHRGNKSFSVEAAAAARRLGAVTVGITGEGASWRDQLVHRLESCEIEDTGGFTKSLTSTLAWVARWIDAPELSEGLRAACSRLEHGPSIPGLEAGADLVLLGDLEREWVAREAGLKAMETAYLRARAFGLEEFLHGPRVSVGPGSVVVAFSDRAEPRWEAVREYLRLVEVPFCEVDGEGLPPAAAWLGQLFWAQRLALETCRRLGIDPDALRNDDPKVQHAREKLVL